MKEFKCKDYYIIKICYYADKNLNRNYKYKDDPVVKKQHWERAKQYNKFKWEFIEHLTNKSQSYWFNDYMWETDMCAFEEIYEKYGIISQICAEGWYYYYIPKELSEVIEWMKNNLVNPYKILQKCKHIPIVETNLNWYRTNSLDFTLKQHKTISIMRSVSDEK